MEATISNVLVIAAFGLLITVTGGIAYLTAVEWRDRRRRELEQREVVPGRVRREQEQQEKSRDRTRREKDKREKDKREKTQGRRSKKS